MWKHLFGNRGGDRGFRTHLDELFDAERWSKRTRAERDRHRRFPRRAARGNTFMVETVTKGGLHEIAGITVRDKRHDSALADLSETELAALRSIVRATLDLSGHESGSALTEVVLTKGTPRIVACEIHDA